MIEKRSSMNVKFLPLFIAMFMLAACETSPPSPLPPRPSTVQAPALPSTRASGIEAGATPATGVERALAEGLELYEKGEYLAATEKLTDPSIDAAWPELRVRALKVLAFSYCVIDKPALCQQAFYDAMKAEPGFKLLPAEQGHPLWGPAFEKARVGPPDSASIASEKPGRGVRKRRF